MHSGQGAVAAAAEGPPLRWLAAAVLMVGALMDLIDVTIVNVALPTIRRDLQASATQLEWVVSGYLLAFAASLIIAGSMGDRFGRKRLFLAGVAVFGTASLCAGLSGTAAELIAARVVQGVGAAAMAPQVLATFRVIFSRQERARRSPSTAPWPASRRRSGSCWAVSSPTPICSAGAGGRCSS
jgi:MFS family permease